LVVSTGACNVTLPNLVDQTQVAATMALTGANLTIGTVTQQCSNTVAAGVVIAQNPAAGSQVASESAVALTVSTGPCEGPPPTEGALRNLLTQTFDAVDGNGDSQISYAEALAALPGLTQAVFSAVDSDGDGQISRVEAGLSESGSGGCAGCSGGKDSFTIDKMKKAFGDLFLAGLSIGVLSLLSRRKTL
jgi:hypothetical protein